MRYVDFIKLEWKSFRRSPNFTKKMGGKIFSFIGYFFLFLYMIGFSVLAFYGIKEKYAEVDPFVKFHELLFIYFFIIFYIRMLIPFNNMKVNHFMLLPIKKTKIISYYIIRAFINPVNIIFILMVFVYSGILIANNYNLFGIIFWSIGILSIVFSINVALLLMEKNQFISTILSFSILFIMIKMDAIAGYFAPIGAYFYKIYHQWEWVVLPIIILILVINIMYTYLSNHFFIDDKVKKKKNEKVKSIQLSWINKYGITGAIIKNDVRMMMRNARPKQSVFGFLVIFIFAWLIFSGIIPDRVLNNNAYGVFLAFMLSGFFVLNFGSFVPAWDSEYFKLLMSQNISYKQYLSAKWNLLSLSVFITLALSIPFLYFGSNIFLMLLAMGIFNLGVNIPMVLLTGLFNTTPIKLNEKVKAFQNNQTVNFKIILLSMLRLFVPIIIYFLVKKYFGNTYAVYSFVVMGIIGLILKSFILNKLTKMYIKNKYKTIHAFSKAEE